MTKPSQANFENNSARPITIKPLDKSAKSWKQFTLNPKDKKQVRDYIVGDDIKFGVYAKPINGTSDALLGEFVVHNPTFSNAGTWNYSPGVAYKASQGLFKIDGKTYKTEYAGDKTSLDKFAMFSSDKGIVGKADTTRFEKKIRNYDASTRTAYYYYYTTNTNSAFDKSMPYFEHAYLGDGNGAKTWEFNFKDWT